MREMEVMNVWIEIIFTKLYSEVTNYVQSCMICQAQSRKRETAPLVETDFSNFPSEKVCMDISGIWSIHLASSYYQAEEK